ncbi:hypothetical protein K437DRAFT_267301 [Tilletiaria anomala UBC 951]|uniref:Uncharacterized protein n=1 Tax=Tilletiaria anomala (strain ATCC 24038 / CBS 436.72 / UBC 951) TaxID=1037660 RepID=A0A066WD05_TILAU|nr:uncharacterized protein K437DRAFT_267301 [Tilletiaria anomala UBC 951]KDN50398.1 hypothetical protein K437DRAFT_267301 [Tilletiaria anomala UBC 951]
MTPEWQGKLFEPHDEDDRAYNTALVLAHTAQKGVQAGALLSVPVLSLAYIVHSRKTAAAAAAAAASASARPTLVPFIMRRVPRFALVTTLVASAMGLGRCVWLTHPHEVFDRAYRVAHNESQQRADRWFATGAGAGAGAVLAVRRGPMRMVLGSALLVGAASLLVHVATWKEPQAAPRSGQAKELLPVANK